MITFSYTYGIILISSQNNCHMQIEIGTSTAWHSYSTVSIPEISLHLIFIFRLPKKVWSTLYVCRHSLSIGKSYLSHTLHNYTTLLKLSLHHTNCKHISCLIKKKKKEVISNQHPACPSFVHNPHVQCYFDTIIFETAVFKQWKLVKRVTLRCACPREFVSFMYSRARGL